jgi:trehalose 6-phosphate phosphatase
MRRRTLLAFDFDGTLAPIVANPDDACVPSSMAQQLGALSKRRPTAVITGRRLADVRNRLGFEPEYLVGNHGAEGLNWVPNGFAMQIFRTRLNQQYQTLQDAGVQVEDKGLSLALHFRNATDPITAEHAVAFVTQDLPLGLTAFGGKCVLNIVDSAAPDKGQAALELLEISGCESLFFVGDDVNDESVFRCARPDWVTVRIGRLQDIGSAMFYLDSYADMNALLLRLQEI